MPPRKTIYSRGSKASRDNAPSRIAENPNIQPRVTEQVEAPPPTVEGISQLLSNWERFNEIQTCAAEIQAQAVEARASYTLTQLSKQYLCPVMSSL